MAAMFFADLVRETSWATGAGALALGGALPGHRSFAAAVPAGARFHYCIAGVTQPEEWETGEGDGTYSVGGTQVVTSRRTGWGAPTGTATRTAFDTATATTAQLAERLKALIDDLTAHGLIGA